MSFQITTQGKYKIIRVGVDIVNLNTRKALEKSVNNLMLMGEKDFVLDFSTLSRMDSQLVGVIGYLFRRVEAGQGSLNVILKDRTMEEVFNLTGFNLLVKVYKGLKDLPGEEKLPRAKPEKVARGVKHLEISARGDFKVIELKGELDTFRTANDFNRVVNDFIDQGDKKFVFDFKKLQYVNSYLLGCVAQAYRRIKEKQGRIYVLTDNPEIQSLFDVSGLAEAVSIFKSQDDFILEAKKRNEDIQQKSILVVDDSRTMRDLLAKKVRDLGYHALTADNGKAAVNVAVNKRPDLILMDVQMPVMDGYSACKEIKKKIRDKYIPVIFFAALKDPKEKLNALEAGGDDFINKPVQDEDLIFRIRTQMKIMELTGNMKFMNENLERMVEEKSKALQETERRLYQSEKMSVVGTMLSGIAHELRNPVCAIAGYAKMLKIKGGLADKQVEQLSHIEEQANRTNKIIENLLNLTRKKLADTRNFDMNKLIESIWESLKFLFTGKAVALESALKAKGTIAGNASEVEQILINLVSNGADAIEGSGKIVVSTFDKGSWYGLAVEDSGGGMDNDVQKKMFDPFFTTKAPGKGTGLGLSIVFKIVEAHQGKIEVQSRVGKGTKVSVLFPKSD
jgi:anti-anti-sigma factor